MKLLVFALLAGLFIQDADLKMEKIKIGKYISLDLPAGFRPLSSEDLIRKYVSSQLPIAAYASADGTADFAANVFASNWTSDDLQLPRQFYQARILSLYDSVSFIQSEIDEINGRPFIVFEFMSSLNPDETAATAASPMARYNYIQYAFLNGKTAVFTFSCPAANKKQWQAAAAAIMESVKIKPGL